MTSFLDVRDYVAIPRITGLRLSPDGRWLAATVQALSQDKKKYVSSIWRIDPGGAAAVQLTRSAEGETAPEFLPDGSLLFLSARPDPAGPGRPAERAGRREQDKAALWLLPAGGGEARRVAAPDGGVSGVAVARATGSVVLAAATLPGTVGAEQDAGRRAARRQAGVTAILHEAGPVRHWDHDLGPDQLRLLSVSIGAGPGAGAPRDLTPAPGRALDEQSFELTPDGSLAGHRLVGLGRTGASARTRSWSST